MTTETNHAPAISCAHCTHTIQRDMMEVDGMRQVVADLESKRVTFSYDAPATPATIQAAMEALGYPLVDGLGSHRSP